MIDCEQVKVFGIEPREASQIPNVHIRVMVNKRADIIFCLWLSEKRFPRAYIMWTALGRLDKDKAKSTAYCTKHTLAHSHPGLENGEPMKRNEKKTL